MKALTLFLAILLVGCTAGPTLEDLEDEAIVSGDWTEVEKRERVLARQNARIGPDCPTGYVSVCYESGFDIECGCVRARGGRFTNAN